MNDENKDSIFETLAPPKPRVEKDYVLPACIVLSATILALTWIYTTGLRASNLGEARIGGSARTIVEPGPVADVTPSAGVVLPVRWGDLGAQLVRVGAIDADRFKSIYNERGEFTAEYDRLLLGQNDGQLKITPENSGYLLNLFWALG